MAVKAHSSEDRQHPAGEFVSCRQRGGEGVKAGGLPLVAEIGRGGAAPYISHSTIRYVERERINEKDWTATAQSGLSRISGTGGGSLAVGKDGREGLEDCQT